jgi:hypothetical protein
MESYISLISGLLGALIGAAASVTGIVVQSRLQAKRDRTKDAIALALEDWKIRLEVIKEHGGGKALPLAVFIHYHARLIEFSEKGELTPDAIRTLNKEQDLLIATIDEINEEWRAKKVKS